MKYEKPKCDCGTNLKLRRASKKKSSYTIKKNGKIYSKPIFEESIDEFYLKCETCNNSYEAYFELMDDRVYRGDSVLSQTYFSDNNQWYRDFK